MKRKVYITPSIGEYGLDIESELMQVSQFDKDSNSQSIVVTKDDMPDDNQFYSRRRHSQWDEEDI